MSRVLALNLDVAANYKLEGSDQMLLAELRGFTIKSQSSLSPMGASSGAVPQPQSLKGMGAVNDGSSSVLSHILEPCNVMVSFTKENNAQNVQLEASELKMKVSPDVLQMLLHMQKVGFFHEQPEACPILNRPCIAYRRVPTARQTYCLVNFLKLPMTYETNMYVHDEFGLLHGQLLRLISDTKAICVHSHSVSHWKAFYALLIPLGCRL